MKLDVKTCLRAGVTIFLLYLCIHYWPSVARTGRLLLSAAMPLLLGAVMAYLVNILMTFYEHRLFGRAASGAGLKLKRPLCMALAFATLLIIVVLLLVLVIPELVSCIRVIAAGVPGVVADFTKWCEEQGILPETIADSLAQIDWKSRMTDIVKVLTAGVGSAANAIVNTVTSVVSGFVTFFMALIFSIYLLLGKEKLGRQLQKIMERYLRDGWNKKIRYVVGVVNDCFHRYIVGQCTEAVILGVLCMLGMLLIRLPYATMIGALIGFTALIPVAGAYIGAIVGAFMILTVSPVKALIFLVFIVILQQLEGNLIYPKVVGSSLGLPALWVLAAVTVGGGVLGIPGMLLGVPLSAAVYRLLLLGLAGCGLFGAGKSTTEGRIGDSIRTDFFEFTVNSAYLCSEFEGRAASEGTELLVVDATVKNTFNESIPMSDWDFQAQWGEDDDDEAYAFPITSDPETGEEIAAVSEDQLPYE